MINKWRLFLLSILFFTFFISIPKVINILFLNKNLLIQTRALYKNVNQSFINYNADVEKQLVGGNDSKVSNSGIIFNWSHFVGNWEEFKENYYFLNLVINMEIAFNWYHIKWESDNLFIPLNKITVGEADWVKIDQIEEPTDQPNCKDMTYAQLEYNCWVEDDNVLIRFRLNTLIFNNYDNYYFTINTIKVLCETKFNYNFIRWAIYKETNKKVLILNSDYSLSLEDKRNKPLEIKAINSLISKALIGYYPLWLPYIGPYLYSDDNGKALIIVEFTDLNTNKDVVWYFEIAIKFNLSEKYWNNEFQKRLTIIPGKIINVESPNSLMITDKPLKQNGKNIYSTTASIRFTANSDGSETMKVNNILVQVIDNIFTFQMTDNQEHGTNEYHILLEKHDLNDFSRILGKYEVKYLIKQNTPNLELTWYAWNPDKNFDQRKLIEPFINGELNTSYDSEVNIKTGTKKQIVWVKNQAIIPFPLDPLDKNGDIIENNKYDQGFLSEGSISGMGIIQTFNDPWIKSVKRIKVDDKTLKPIDNLDIIKADKDGSYFSLSGTYLYVYTDQKEVATSKFIIIGQKWQDKYPKFLDVINNSNVAVSFWNTIQGFHLKNYLAYYKKINIKNIKDLSFEQVSSYWKEYVSDVSSQRINLKINLVKNLDLNTITLNALKFNSNDIIFIKNNIIFNINKQLEKYQLKPEIDFQIIDLEKEINNILNYDDKGNAFVNLKINAVDNSLKARNNTVVSIRNSKNFDVNKIIDLSKIKFGDYQYNFSSFTSKQLKEWIFKVVANKFKKLNLLAIYQVDYHINPLDDNSFEQFINAKSAVKLKINISSDVLSNLLINNTTLTIINDLKYQKAPLIPLNDKEDENLLSLKTENNALMTKKQNLIIISIIIAIVFISTITILFFWYRFKKGIVKKIRNKKKNNK